MYSLAELYAIIQSNIRNTTIAFQYILLMFYKLFFSEKHESQCSANKIPPTDPIKRFVIIVLIPTL